MLLRPYDLQSSLFSYINHLDTCSDSHPSFSKVGINIISRTWILQYRNQKHQAEMSAYGVQNTSKFSNEGRGIIADTGNSL